MCRDLRAILNPEDNFDYSLIISWTRFTITQTLKQHIPLTLMDWRFYSFRGLQLKHVLNWFVSGIALCQYLALVRNHGLGSNLLVSVLIIEVQLYRLFLMQMKAVEPLLMDTSPQYPAPIHTQFETCPRPQDHFCINVSLFCLGTALEERSPFTLLLIFLFLVQ